jgi:hypothetical protein
VLQDRRNLGLIARSHEADGLTSWIVGGITLDSRKLRGVSEDFDRFCDASMRRACLYSIHDSFSTYSRASDYSN